MSSYSSSNTEPERWAKIIEGADSGRYPEILIDDGKLVAMSVPSIANSRIQNFLADVFKDGDNEWFRSANDSVESTRGKAANDGQSKGGKTKNYHIHSNVQTLGRNGKTRARQKRERNCPKRAIFLKSGRQSV